MSVCACVCVCVFPSHVYGGLLGTDKCLMLPGVSF